VILKINTSFESYIYTMKRLVVFSGAGMSAESGIKTFRDSGGLWEEYEIMDVATPEAWQRQPQVVLEFYNARRKQVIESKPNEGHRIIAELESHFDVNVITQNIDDLHERAGSSKVLHLHGEIRKSKSSIKPNLIYPIEGEKIEWGETCELGSQLRPHVVWFGEEVPMMMPAERLVNEAEIFVIVGTSLNVYPAASLVFHARRDCNIFLVDPGEPLIPSQLKITWIKEKAGDGMRKVKNEIL
jgi:NAD-dependent deacetylase